MNPSSDSASSAGGRQRLGEAPPDTSPGPYTGGPLEATGIFSSQPLMRVEGDRLVLPDVGPSPTLGNVAAAAGGERIQGADAAAVQSGLRTEADAGRAGTGAVDGSGQQQR
ncbi:hypothetical protein PLESTB_001610100 [Pleodorina starrii]|uniref:Uncharacterized protein n=1 Tax=Pleodorina starrii TaxID=330485 RepID=A0A9W6F8N8_9CHLO|nr:hypothetical protein PLESTM_000170500 [Pleodorina starrii]GLC60418.1 hypothetical protein PLESTB_001610100 [Pleodorina starrii]GLC64147.1 hypothetical protein PLESTF_000129500 [Pleodorina starrii]